MKKKILVFSGAGVSAESGIKTFRDYNGLWENYTISDVASPEGWKNDPQLVLSFYNDRRAQLKTVVPNEAHLLIASLEETFDVSVVTQNVDDLHERAGSSFVTHLHGELKKVRSTIDKNLIYSWENDLTLSDKCEKGSQLRPHIVWFGEALDEEKLQLSKSLAMKADYCIIVGTSLVVYPAAEIPSYTKKDCTFFLIDPKVDELATNHFPNKIIKLATVASEGMKFVVEWLQKNS